MQKKPLAQKKAQTRQLVLKQGTDHMNESELLETFLCLSLNTPNYSKIAADLLKRYGTIANMLKATPQNLMTVEGVSESMAVYISLIHDIKAAMYLAKNRDTKYLKTIGEREEYVKNILISQIEERVLIINLDKRMKVINYHFVGSGGVNFSQVSKREILKTIVDDNPTYSIVCHNHPGGFTKPSSPDIDFTINLMDVLKKVNVELIDHIIVGDGQVLSLFESEYFDLMF